jgi:hypothetical protein
MSQVLKLVITQINTIRLEVNMIHVGELLFGKPKPKDIYKLLAHKRDLKDITSKGKGLGKAFKKGYLDDVLAIDKTKKAVTVKDIDKLLGIAKIYQNGGELRKGNKKLTIKLNPYKALICYGLVLNEIKNHPELVDFHRLAEIQEDCRQLLSHNKFDSSKYGDVSWLNMMEKQLVSTKR